LAQMGWGWSFLWIYGKLVQYSNAFLMDKEPWLRVLLDSGSYFSADSCLSSEQPIPFG
jgi:hypothetical protein